jgi:hypothetical protein
MSNELNIENISNPEKEEKEEKEENVKEKEEPLKDLLTETLSNTLIKLQLGDIIKITDTTNEILNNQTFFIEYIDLTKIKLINTNTLIKTELTIQPDKTIDNSISEIILLNRNKYPGYAKQNGLDTDKWITIYFGGDIPTVITCQITNLEEDMIELKIYPDGNTIYINFNYQGIPEDLPIEYIEIREKPSDKKSGPIELELEKEKQLLNPKNIIIEAPIHDVKAQLKAIILNADQIKFGNEDLGSITQLIDVNIQSHRYSIDTQTADLLDSLLSKYPISQRTRSVLNIIHLTIERFKQLRENFSLFDEFGNINAANIHGANYKPLEEYFNKFNKKIFWILPVIKNIKKLYDAKSVRVSNDYTNEEIEGDLIEMDEIIKKYKSKDVVVEENKYDSLYKELNFYFTPFTNINDEKTNEVINIKQIKENIITIVDNLDDFKSSVIFKEQIKQRQFITQQLNLGLNKLHATNFSGSKMISKITPLTDADLLYIKSFITLPEPAIRFSRVNMPSSSIFEKANLSQTFLNLWQLLKKNSKVNNVNINSLNKDIEYSEFNFVNNIKNYVMNIDHDELKSNEELKHLTKEEIYQKFINIIIPKTFVLFNLMKKYINTKLSIVDIVGFLEPFNIYSNSLNYLQYKEITKFIDQEISKFNKNFVVRSNIFAKLKLASLIKNNKENVFSITNTLQNKDQHDLIREVFYEYDFNDLKNEIFTNSELLRKISLKDYGNLYSSAVSLKNISLMFPNDFTNLLSDEEAKKGEEINKEMESNKCNNVIVAKLYKNEQELLNDNFEESSDLEGPHYIYFDKNYDTTNYNFLEKYENEMFNMNPDKFLLFLKEKIKKEYKLNDTESEYLTDTLINGYKKVIDGQYAIIYLNDSLNYYIRKNNKWVLDENIDKNAGSDDTNIICNLQDKCISMQDNCETTDLNKFQLQNKLLKNIINEFDKKYTISQNEFKEFIFNKYKYNFELLPKIIKIEYENMLKYNNQKSKLSHTIEEGLNNVIVSPYLNLRDLILAQEDFVKTQKDIIQFVNKFTRKAYTTTIGPLGQSETDHWLYCVVTNTPLLPKFKYDIANVFFDKPDNFQNEVDIIITNLGAKQSDDGDYWVDENSGWRIQKIDFSTEEGYESGFKISTKSVLEKDIGDSIITSAKEVFKPLSPEISMINNIIDSITFEININIDNQKEFIINIVSEMLRNTLPNEEEYKRKIKNKLASGITIPSYEFIYHSFILNFTIAMILITIQINIPSIKTRKTFPNCKKSFTGYPFEGPGDLSSLNYISCVVFNMKSKSIPWYTLSRLKQEDISKKIHGFIDEYLLELPEVKRKMDEKIEYLLLNQEIEISTAHDIKNWTQFLPPLIPFTVKSLNNISSEFKSKLKQELVNGLSEQREHILEIESKMILFSLAIQEKIQNIIRKKSLLLKNQNNIPYLENSCCDEKKTTSVIQYFEDEDSNITEYNSIVTNLSNLMIDINHYSKAILIYSNINTKNIYPPLSQTFDETTIYLAFIYFCRFKSQIPIDDALLPLCTEKPDISPKDTYEEIISKLKKDGKNYTNETFLRLFQLVSQKNIMNIDTTIQTISSTDNLLLNLDTIDPIDPENTKDDDKNFTYLLKTALNTFTATENTTQEIKNLNNFLIKNIRTMKTDIQEFITQNRSATTTKKKLKEIELTISNFSNWRSEKNIRNENNKISNDSLYNIVQFLKTTIKNIVNIFPNTILKKIDYSDIQISNHWDLSYKHKNDIQTSIDDYYNKFKVFYYDPILYNILVNIQKISANIITLSSITPCFTSIKYKGKEIKPVFDERTSKYLYEYYLLKCFINYIDLAENDGMIIKKFIKKSETFDLVTVEYLDDITSGTDYESKDTRKSMLAQGNKKELKIKVSNLLVVFLQSIEEHISKVNYSYEDIMDKTFKIKEREKNNMTSRLQALSEEERETDTILKINKLGVWSKGLQKGLTTYVKDNFDEEREDMEKMMQYEKNLIKHNNSTGENVNLDDFINEFVEYDAAEDEIERENLNLEGYTGDDGNYDEDDEQNEIDFDS